MSAKRKAAVMAPSDAKAAAGDNYGLGYKAKVGKMRGDSVGYRPVSKKQLRTPPRNTV